MVIDVIINYIRTYFLFLLQLVLPEIMLVFALRRKKLFILRLICGVLTLSALTVLIAFLQPFIPDYPLLGALPYFVLFAFTIVIMKMCFDCPIKILVLCGVAAYSLQNMLYRVMSLFEITGTVWRFSQVVGNYNLAYWLIYAPVLLTAYVAAYFLFVRRIHAKGIENIYSRNVMFISAVTLSITLVLCSYTNAYWWQYQLSIVNYCFTILSNLFVITIISGMFENVGLRNEISAVRRLWEQDKRQYELAKENIDIINIKCHDLKHKIQSLRLSESGISAEELKEIENCTAIYDGTVKTGCASIDVLLTEKSLICIKRGIKLTCMADCSGLWHLSESELYSLFGNMLSNAINAVVGIDDLNRRIIDLTVKRIAGMTMIDCLNYTEGGLIIKDGFPQTTEADKSVHGFGTKSMSMLVKKYGGEIYFSQENGVFSLKIMLPEKLSSSRAATAA